MRKLTLDEDIEFWERAYKHEGQSKDMALLSFGIAAGLRMAKQDHASEVVVAVEMARG
jgi:hypothetical protein